MKDQPELDFLPEAENYQSLKTNIYTRRELNRVIQSLKAFSKAGGEELITLDSGQRITEWEYGELKSLRSKAVNRLQKEYDVLATPKPR